MAEQRGALMQSLGSGAIRRKLLPTRPEEGVGAVRGSIELDAKAKLRGDCGPDSY
jgi:hypothetical protein